MVYSCVWSPVAYLLKLYSHMLTVCSTPTSLSCPILLPSSLSSSVQQHTSPFLPHLVAFLPLLLSSAAYLSLSFPSCCLPPSPQFSSIPLPFFPILLPSSLSSVQQHTSPFLPHPVAFLPLLLSSAAYLLKLYSHMLTIKCLV